jgi:beta-1,4-galactosyltransferase 1
MPYDGFFGGAVALSTENIKQMNGFSNLFYGWGGEDDDTLNRYYSQQAQPLSTLCFKCE